MRRERPSLQRYREPRGRDGRGGGPAPLTDDTAVRTPLRRADEDLAEALEDPEFRAKWTRLAPARAVTLRLVGYRIEHGLTQTALGRRLGMPQPAVARLEAADHVPSLETLLRLAETLDIEFLLSIKPGPAPTTWVTTEAERAAVVQQITTAGGASLLVAAG